MRGRRTKGKSSVFAETTSMTMGRRGFIAAEIEITRSFGKDGSSGMAETLVPQVGGDGGGEAVA